MQIKKDTKVKVPYCPELGTGAVLQVAEAPGGEYQVDVVFEKGGKDSARYNYATFLTTVPGFAVTLRFKLLKIAAFHTINLIALRTVAICQFFFING